MKEYWLGIWVHGGFNPCTSITVEQTKTAREKEGGTDIAAG